MLTSVHPSEIKLLHYKTEKFVAQKFSLTWVGLHDKFINVVAAHAVRNTTWVHKCHRNLSKLDVY